MAHTDRAGGRMSFGQWYLRRGRIDRRTYWLHYVVPLLVLTALATAADVALGFVELTASTTAASLAEAAGTLGPLTVAVTLLTVVPAISSEVARLHDRGHSAWWLLWNLVPLAGPLVLLVQTGFLPGSPGPNRYGPPPWRRPGDGSAA